MSAGKLTGGGGIGIASILVVLLMVLVSPNGAIPYGSYGSAGSSSAAGSTTSITFQLPQANDDSSELATSLTTAGRSYGSGANTASSSGTNSYHTAVTRDQDAIVYPDDITRDSYGNIAKPYVPLEHGQQQPQGSAAVSPSSAPAVNYPLPSYAGGILNAGVAPPSNDLLPPPLSSSNFNYPSVQQPGAAAAPIAASPAALPPHPDREVPAAGAAAAYDHPATSLNEVLASPVASKYPSNVVNKTPSTVSHHETNAAAAAAGSSASTYTHGKFTGSFGGAPGILGEQKVPGTAVKPTAAPAAQPIQPQPVGQQDTGIGFHSDVNRDQTHHFGQVGISATSAPGSYSPQQPQQGVPAQGVPHAQQNAGSYAAPNQPQVNVPLPAVATNPSYSPNQPPQQVSAPLPPASGSYGSSYASAGAATGSPSIAAPGGAIEHAANNQNYQPSSGNSYKPEFGSQPQAATGSNQNHNSAGSYGSVVPSAPPASTSVGQQHQQQQHHTNLAANLNEHSSPSVSPAHSDTGVGGPGYGSALAAILGEQKQPGYGVSGAATASPASSAGNHLHQEHQQALPSPSSAVAHHQQEGTSGKYSGGFGGPPGVLSPYDKNVVAGAKPTASADAHANAYAGPNKRY